MGAGVRRTVAIIAVIAALTTLAASVPSIAVAGSAASTQYASNASATMFSGLAFDTCTAPSRATMLAWTSSPYGAAGIYLGGVNRTCRQPELSADWVSQVTGLGWRLLPIYKGPQPPCGARPRDQKIGQATATAQGIAAADDARARADTLGLLPGSAFYNDIENYRTTDSACRAAVLGYLSAWTTRLHQYGYLSGVYVNLSSGAADLNRSYRSVRYARPDAIWIARYDGRTSLTGWPGIGDDRWAVHQRAKQYLGNERETYGGATLSIDRDRLDAPVATVSYPHLVTGSAPLDGHAAPSAGSPVLTGYQGGSAVRVVCQTPGTAAGGSKVWDKLSDGSYVPDRSLDTSSETGYSWPIARCSYGYQVSDRAGLNARSGPGIGYPVAGRIAAGSVAWAGCQRAGSSVWFKLLDGRWLAGISAGRYPSGPSTGQAAGPVPRC